MSNAITSSTSESAENRFNLHLGRELFSDPQRDKNSAVMVANHPDRTAGISAGDLVRVDFTANTIDSDDLYIVTIKDEWIGYKRFQHMVTGALWARGEDEDILVTPDILKTIKVVGKVKDIYRKAKAA